MLAKVSAIALVGAVAVSALDSRAVHNVVLSRQISESQIPTACQGDCTSALSIYNACLNGDTQTCLSVCNADTYSGFVGCFSCILDQTPGVTETEVDELNSAISTLQAACAQYGSTVSAASLTAPAGGAVSAGSGSLSGAANTLTGASFTSASGGLTVGGAPASSAAAGTAAGASSASPTAGANSPSSAAPAASSAPAASPTGAAGLTAQLPNFAGVALGAIGIAAGAVFAL